MCPRAHVIRVDYPTDDTCATVHVRHATTDRKTRTLPTGGHARPCVHLAERWITNLCAHRSLCYSTRARWLHVGTPAHVCTVYGRLVLNLRARAGRYTTHRYRSPGSHVLLCVRKAHTSGHINDRRATKDTFTVLRCCDHSLSP